MSRASSVARRARRALGKSPQEIARRLVEEATREVEAVIGPRRARRFDDARLLEAVDAPSLVELWERIRARPYPAVTTPAEATAIAGHRDVLEAAENACGSRVDLLGSGPQRLTSPIDWHTDFTTGFSWPLAIARRIDYVNLDRPSDVKIPWELSRLQWLLPVGEAYLLTGDERYARHAREVLEDWIAANPYGRGVNWAVALEAAMRVFTWTWLFHALAGSDAWQEDAFRSAFLRTLFLHGHFIDRNIERSDVNGNHYTADAAGLVFVGSFFGQGSAATRWAARGWTILLDEQPRQLNADGVDFEASLPYHRLVTELFCLPALYRRRLGLAVPESYDERLRSAAAFAATYTRVDGTSPHWGDADDARMLPLGRGRLTDHRYLAGLVGVGYSGPTTDVAWIRGPAEAAELEGGEVPGSASFPLGGFHVLRREGDHAFFDCGPIGLAGRGGHGHNDALAFELALDGVTLITDSGSYVYTADWRARN